MVHGSADISMREFDPRRFGAYADKKWQVVKAREDYCLRHEIPFPHFNRTAGRPVKPSPLYKTLKGKGAVFEEVYGHERPRWFATDGMEPVDQYSFRRNAVHERIGKEVESVRQRVGIMDITAFSKVEVIGDESEAFLDVLVANNMPRKTGSAILTHILNHRGRIELEVTIVKLAEQRYYIVCAAFFEQRLLDHLARYQTLRQVEIINRSGSWAALALQGPRSRDVLAENTDARLDNKNFRWLSAQQITVAGQPVIAIRMSYSGELGWEIHAPNESVLAVYEALWKSGVRHGIANYGSFAMNIMRMEKCFKGASELTNEVTLPEADVMRFVAMDKGDFVGRQQTAQSLAGELPWVCAYLELESDGIRDGHGGEPVLFNDEVVGAISSIVYGHTVKKGLAFAFIKPFAAVPGTRLTVMVMGNRRNAIVRAEAAYDPDSLLPRKD